VVSTQLIVRSLTAIRSAIEDSFQGFIKFNQAAAEIQTILDQPLEEIRGHVRQLSDAFNTPILDVAKAKYQAISNGFITASDSSKVLTAALKFGKVGVASATDSVDLISTALNAYGNSADHAETISAKLFKTVQLGRVVGTELANSFGRVAPIAKEVGASEDEILAAFSSITIGGVKASEAATQIRATLTALLKPSDAATDAFRKLGVESGEQLIQAKGFQGALQSLIGATDGSASAVARLFPNVRSLNGVLRETGTGANIFQDHLREIQQASASLLNKKYDIRIQSNAEQVAASLNKLGNAFKVDVGEQLVEATHAVLQFVGGTDTLIAAGGTLLPILAAGTAALLTYSGALATVSAKNSILRASNDATRLSFGRLAGSLSLLTAAFGAVEIGHSLGKYIQSQIEEARNAIAKASKDYVAGQAEAAAKIAQDAHRASDEKFRDENSISAKLKSIYNLNVDAAKASNDQLVTDSQSAMDKIVKQFEDGAAKAKSAWEKAKQDIGASKKNQSDLQGTLQDRRFDAGNKRLSPLQLSSKDQERALELSKASAQKLARGDREGSDALARRADSYASAAASAAEASKSTVQMQHAEQTIQTLIQNRIRAESQYQATRAKDGKAAEKSASDQLSKATKLKAIGEDFGKNAKLYGEDGNPLGGKDLAAHLQGARKNVNDFEKISGVKIPELGIAKAGLDSLAQTINGDLATRRFVIKNLILDASTLKGPKTLGELLGEGTTQRTEKHEADSNAINSRQRLSNLTDQETAARTHAALLLQAKPSLGENVVSGFKSATSNVPYPKQAQQEGQLNSLFARTLALTQQKAPIRVDQLQNLNNEALKQSAAATQALGGRFETLAAALAALTQAVSRGGQQAAPAAASAPQPTMIEEPEEPEGHALGGLIQGFAKGGLVRYMAGGGFVPKGTDTVPAMLSVGEMVIPAGPTKQFYSQLQSIRAGRAPENAGAQAAGDTHIHAPISIHGSNQSPQQIAKAVAAHITRMQRTGSK
jgi:TP901 family phage tail tape measure protein